MIVPYKHGDIRDTLLAIANELPGYTITWTISDKRNVAAILIEEKSLVEVITGVGAGDIIFCDEDNKVSGTGSSVEVRRHKNVEAPVC